MGLINIIKTTKQLDEREKMLEFMLLAANELDEVIKQITDKSTIADYDKFKPSDPKDQ